MLVRSTTTLHHRGIVRLYIMNSFAIFMPDPFTNNGTLLILVNVFPQQQNKASNNKVSDLHKSPFRPVLKSVHLQFYD